MGTHGTHVGAGLLAMAALLTQRKIHQPIQLPNLQRRVSKENAEHRRRHHHIDQPLDCVSR